jgi:transposase
MEAVSVPSSSCPGCIEAAKRIATLEARIVQLEALVEQLRRGGKRQAAPFSKGVPKADPKPPGRKSGENYGTHHRRAIAPQVDEVYEAPLPACCPGCGGRVVQTDVARQYQTEIPRKVNHRQFNVHVGRCADCQRRVQGRHELQTSDALGAAASQIGPDAQALAVQLNKEAGLSHGKIGRFFQAAFALDLSRSGACRVMLRAARRCQPAYQAIVARVRQSPLIVPDETGWKIGGLLAWLHVAVGADATAYLVHRQRGYEAAVELIGPDYEGFLTHDGWSPYMRFILATHQTCLGHLLRRSHELEESATGGAVRFPRQIKAIFQDALAVRDQRDSGELTLRQAREQAARLSTQMDQLVIPCKVNADNERFARHLWNQQESLFTFLQFEGVDATNYKAELALRLPITNRKVWGGNRTDIGANAQSVLASVIRTAAQRRIQAVEFISSTLKAACFGKLPQLFPATG